MWRGLSLLSLAISVKPEDQLDYGQLCSWKGKPDEYPSRSNPLPQNNPKIVLEGYCPNVKIVFSHLWSKNFQNSQDKKYRWVRKRRKGFVDYWKSLESPSIHTFNLSIRALCWTQRKNRVSTSEQLVCPSVTAALLLQQQPVAGNSGLRGGQHSAQHPPQHNTLLWKAFTISYYGTSYFLPSY